MEPNPDGTGIVTMKVAGSTGCVPCDLSVQHWVHHRQKLAWLRIHWWVLSVDLQHAITGFPCSRLCSGSYPGERKQWKFYAPEIQEARFVGDFFHTVAISFQQGMSSTCSKARWLKMNTFPFCSSSNCFHLAKALLLLCRHSFLPLLKTNTSDNLHGNVKAIIS